MLTQIIAAQNCVCVTPTEDREGQEYSLHAFAIFMLCLAARTNWTEL